MISSKQVSEIPLVLHTLTFYQRTQHMDIYELFPYLGWINVNKTETCRSECSDEKHKHCQDTEINFELYKDEEKSCSKVAKCTRFQPSYSVYEEKVDWDACVDRW